jgi:two-component system response regulator YesN
MEHERIRMLIVDDEPLILRSLKQAVNWDAIGVDIVGEARSGEEALKLCRAEKPDLVLSDIRMPSIDGLELMKRVKREDADTVFILISGYGEFEYAREGLREGASDYILKPIDHDELAAAVQKAAAEIRSLRERRRQEDRLLHSVKTLSMLARERMYAQVMEGIYETDGKWKWLAQSELDKRYFMFLIGLDQFEQLRAGWSDGEYRLWMFVVRNIVEEIGEREGALAVFPFHQGEWVMLWAAAARRKQREIAAELIDALKRYARLTVSIGISRVFEGLPSLEECYQSAKRALLRRFYAGGGQWFPDPDDDPDEGTHRPDERTLGKLRALERRLLNDIKVLNGDRAVQALDEWGDAVREASLPREMVEQLYLELSALIRRQLEFMMPDSGRREELLLTLLRGSESAEDMLARLKRKVQEWIGAITDGGWSKEQIRASVKRAIEFIADHYHRDIGIDEAAEAAGVSVSHFCYTFKQETGMTFLEYLTRFRIDKACYMLEHTDVKVFQVSQLVGYQDAKYFSQVFRKMTGMKPSEYREQARRKEG